MYCYIIWCTLGWSLSEIHTSKKCGCPWGSMYQLSTVLGSLVSLLAGTIDFLYKKALHTSYIVSETLSRAPDAIGREFQSHLLFRGSLLHAPFRFIYHGNLPQYVWRRSCLRPIICAAIMSQRYVCARRSDVGSRYFWLAGGQVIGW